MDYEEVEERIKASYRLATAQYRRDDEIEVTTENHRRLGHVLKHICLSFANPIAALDAGCGTGRYFHCLENVAHLTGLDISEDMLAAAKTPVLGHEITARKIELIRGNVHLASFSAGTFDFIYSLGMFGHGCPVTVEVCNKFHEWLKPGGKLLFNVVDMAGLGWSYRGRRRLRSLLYPRLPRRVQRALDEREKRSPFFGLTRDELLKILAASRFQDYTVASHTCKSPLWNGRHLECLALRR